MKIRSRQTIGEELPRPGTGVRQSTFSVPDHASGYPRTGHDALAGRPPPSRPVTGRLTFDRDHRDVGLLRRGGPSGHATRPGQSEAARHQSTFHEPFLRPSTPSTLTAARRAQDARRHHTRGSHRRDDARAQIRRTSKTTPRARHREAAS